VRVPLIGLALACQSDLPHVREVTPPPPLPSLGTTASIDPGAFSGTLVSMVPQAPGEFTCVKGEPPPQLAHLPPYVCDRNHYNDDMWDRAWVREDRVILAYWRQWRVPTEALARVLRGKVDSLTRLWGKPHECPHLSQVGLTAYAWHRGEWIGRAHPIPLEAGRRGVAVGVHLVPAGAVGLCGDGPRSQ
jgi:hypothetical protein